MKLDLQQSTWSPRSGLAPVSAYSVIDHMRAALLKENPTFSPLTSVSDLVNRVASGGGGGGAATPPTITNYVQSSNLGTGNLDVALSGANDGDWMTANVIIGNTTTTITTPAGWTLLSGPNDLGSRRSYLYGRIKQTGDTLVSFVKSATVVARAVLGYGPGGQPVNTWIVGAYKARATAPAEATTVSRAPSVTSTVAQSLALGFLYEATSATEGSTAVLAGTNWVLGNSLVQLDATTIEQVHTATQTLATAGASGDVQATYPNAQASNGGGIQLIIPPSNVGGGQTSFKVADLLAETFIQVAHRGLGGSYPEQSMNGYDAAVAAGFKAVEASLQVTSDGVFVLSHDATPDRVFGTTGAIPFSSRTWASVSGFSSATGPILRLENLLDKYAKTRVIFLDDKTNANTAALIAAVEAHATANSYVATEHFVWKGFKGWSPAADQWTVRGYQAWGIYYNAGDEPQTAPTRFGNFTILGLDYNASSANWTAIKASGKKVLAHVTTSAADRTTGIANGADGQMATNITAKV